MTEEILLQLEEAARDLTFKPALMAVARKYGMVDLGGKVLWPAPFIKKARNAHARARRDHLEYVSWGRELGILRDLEEAQ